MFKIEVYVEDKNLAHVLRAMTGLIRGLPAVVPVVNVEERRELKAQTGGKILDMFAQFISDKTKFGPSEVEQFLRSVGRPHAPANRTYLVTKAKKAGMIRSTGASNNIQYLVVRRLTHQKAAANG